MARLSGSAADAHMNGDCWPDSCAACQLEADELRWFCELHRTWQDGDCEGCDDDLIAMGAQS